MPQPQLKRRAKMILADETDITIRAVRAPFLNAQLAVKSSCCQKRREDGEVVALHSVMVLSYLLHNAWFQANMAQPGGRMGLAMI